MDERGIETDPAERTDRVTFAPGVPDLAALGAGRAAELLGTRGEPETWGRSEVVPTPGHSQRVRLPLPGTPDERGRVHERPRGAGTGHVWLERFGPDTGWGELLRTRLTAPPSASVAERHWNLYCHLRGAGVVTPEPMAVGARGRGPLSRRSFLVLREPEGGLALPEWWAATGGHAKRRQALEALGAALARLLASGAVLPELAPEDVLLVEDEGGDCAAKELAASAAERGRRRRRLPDVVVTSVAGGRLAPSWTTAERRGLVERFGRALTGAGVGARDLARLVRHARSVRAELREDWRALSTISNAPRGDDR